MFKVIVEDSHKRTMDRFKSGGRETKRVREKDFVKLLPLISNIKKKNEKLTTWWDIWADLWLDFFFF